MESLSTHQRACPLHWRACPPIQSLPSPWRKPVPASPRSLALYPHSRQGLVWPRPPADWREGRAAQVSGPWPPCPGSCLCVRNARSLLVLGAPWQCPGRASRPLADAPACPPLFQGSMSWPRRSWPTSPSEYWLDVVLHRDGLRTPVGAGPQRPSPRASCTQVGLPSVKCLWADARGASGHTPAHARRTSHTPRVPQHSHTLRVTVTYTLRAPRSHSHTLGDRHDKRSWESPSGPTYWSLPLTTHTWAIVTHSVPGCPGTHQVPRSHSHTRDRHTHTPWEPWSYSHTLRRSSHTHFPTEPPGVGLTHTRAIVTHMPGVPRSYFTYSGTQVTHTFGCPEYTCAL